VESGGDGIDWLAADHAGNSANTAGPEGPQAWRGVVGGSECDGLGSSRLHQHVCVCGGGGEVGGVEELFLGAFAKLRNATMRFVVSVRLSASNISAPTRHIFMQFDI
jgi:hypothetical protein